ncbi:MAG TPA: hypothetical protein VGL46_15040 [Pseudonocardiaceae bacterium]
MSSEDTNPGMQWTPWAQAFRDADGLVTSFRAARPNLQARTHDVLFEQLTAVLAYVIAVEATERGVDPGEVPLFTLHNTRLDPLRITSSIAHAAGAAPAAEDPGQAAFTTITALAGDRARRDEWGSLLEAARTLVAVHIAAAIGTTDGAEGAAVRQRRGQAVPPLAASAQAGAARAPSSPDQLLDAMPPAVRHRLGTLRAAAAALVLSFLDADRAGVAHHAQEIATYDDRPENAGSPFTGKWPGGRFGFAVTETTRLATDMLDAVLDIGENPFTHASTARGVWSLIIALVPEEHQAAAIAVAGTLLPEDDRRLDAVPVLDGAGGIAELFAAAALAAWLGGGSTTVFPAKELLRTMLVGQIQKYTGFADGFPAAETITKISDAEALEFLDGLMSSDRGPAVVHHDPGQRTLLELNLLAAAKAHLLTHPQRTPDTDLIMLAAMERVVVGDHGMNTVPGLQPDGMTETERRRAAKLAARHERGTKKDRRR